MTLMTSSLVFIRHAETALSGTFCGQSDPPLSEEGEAQLLALRVRLEASSPPLEIAAIYTSDLLRARQTADFLAAQRSLPVHLRPALREIDFGDWETLTWQDIEQRDRAFAARWVAEFPALPAPNGELIPLFKHRVLAEITFLRQVAQAQPIAVVTHAGVLRVLLEELGHFSPHHAWERTRDYTCTIRCFQQTPTGYLDVQP